ncbi:MAG: hypothetical protein P4L98_12050 [Ancalomicrobiaceae bacterium]|nr:hypothetical protein [Ancalomicrobiaceae bacterium]
MRISAIVSIAAATLALSLTPASAQTIYTGGKTGAYFSVLCPALVDGLRTEGFTPKCQETTGTLDNINKLLADPTGIAFVQGDAYANWAQANPDQAKKLVTIRDDLASEGVYFVSKNQTQFADVVRLITRIKIVLPPQTSGAAQTFENLKKVLPQVFAKVDASQITYTDSAAKAVDLALANDNTLALFVQLPDPANELFKTIVEKKGHFITLVARALLSQKVGGENVYTLETRPVASAGLIKSALEVTTIATPITIIAQSTENIPDQGNARVNHDDLIKIIKSTPKEKLLPKSGPTASLFNRAFTATKETATSLVDKTEAAIKDIAK